jgi:CheY-like chemotaxis protein
MKQHQGQSNAKPKILVVEDDKEDRDIFSYVFTYRTDCCELLFVEDGAKAINLLKSLTSDDLPSLIVLDYNLPGFKGCEIIEQLSQIEKIKPIPKVIYSTYSDQRTIGSCMKAGAKAYFRKSNTMGGVMHDIDHILKYLEGTDRRA